MIQGALHEIFATRTWDFVPSVLHGYKRKLDENIALHIPYIAKAVREDRPFILSSRNNFTERIYAENADWINFDKLDAEDKVINVIDIQGAIMRNGGACSYGSKEHKAIIMRAADNEHTIGHLILMDSGGGSSYAKYDYQDAIDYARSKGQPVIGLINGMACSAGYAPMAMCHEVYVVGLHDQVGCIGTMAAFYTNQNGDINTITQERYVEEYADDCPYKNKEFRDAAEGNNTALKEDLKKLCKDFQELVAKYRPQTTEEQRKGDTYNAGDVIGTMVDAQGTFESCIARIMELSGTSKPAGTSSSTANKPAGADGHHSSATSDNNNQVTIKKENMKEYPKIMSALGLQALVSDKDNGLYFTESMADALVEFISSAEQTKSTLQAKLQEITQLNSKIAEQNSKIEQMLKDHTQALADLAAAHTTAIENLKAEHQTEVNTLNGQLSEANAQITAKDAEILELSNATQNPPAPETPPAGNDTGGKQDPEFKVESVCKPGMTTAQKQEATRKRMEELANRRFS